MEKKLNLKDIVLIGRTFDEYCRMFDLGGMELKNEKIIDIASGVSSFSAEAHSRGYNVTTSDRIYCFSPEEIGAKCAADLELVIEKISPVMDLYTWDFFKDTRDLRQHRERAYKAFIEDYSKSWNSRYVYTEYPVSGFEDKQFTTALVSHFLFMYDEHLDYEFHRKTIAEIIRITSGEIRIFPLVNLKGMRSEFVGRLMEDPLFKACEMTVRKVDYEFVKNGNEMLVITVG